MSKKDFEKQSLKEKKLSGFAVARNGVRVLDAMVDMIVLCIFLLLLMYGSYSLLRNTNIYRQADSSRYEMYRPTEGNENAFAELQEINSDAIAWLTIYGTNINYPVMHGDEKDTYVNTDPFGEPSISGSLYLEHRQPADFSSFSSIIYGHHMQKERMFGELDRYASPEYMVEHTYGNLYFNGKDHGLLLFAFIEADAYDDSVYRMRVESGQEESYVGYLLSRSSHNQEVTVTADDRIALLSTCVSSNKNKRYIVVGLITEEVYSITNIPNAGADKVVQTISNISAWFNSILLLFAVLIIFIFLIILYVFSVKKKRVVLNAKSGDKEKLED